MLFLHHMATNSFHLQLFLIPAIFLSYTKSIDFNYPAVFNFGDSNSDTGNLVTAGIEGLGPPNGQTYFQKPSGSVIFAVDAMDMPFLNAYLDSIAAPIFKKGSNFAAAGSTILPAAATSVIPFSFGIQVLQFVQFKSRALYLLSKEIV